MTLFTHNRKHFPQNGHRRVIIIEPSLPGFMGRLDILCHQTMAHQLPVKMKFIGESLSDHGQPMAVYACPYHGCTWREGWVVDRRNPRRPLRLWARFYRR